MKQTYTYSQVLPLAIAYFEGDELAAQVWAKKYCLKDKEGNYLERTPDDMHHRIASELHRMELKYPNPLSYSEIFQAIAKFKYIVPQGSPMAGIGNDYRVQSLSNCFVIGNDFDSYGGIHELDQQLVQLMKRRAGVGMDISHLRPNGSAVSNAAGTSTGAASFMERFSNSTREVAQSGRRGALLLSISIEHPDSEDFIDMKMDKGKVTGANVSVKLTDKFIEAVRNNTTFTQSWPIGSDNPTVTKKVNAKELWDKLMHNAWSSAEPGVFYWDTIIRESVADCYADLGFKTVSTNPCGEVTLSVSDSCRLLAINLFSFVQDSFTDSASFDWDNFVSKVRIAMRLMDDIVDLELEKIGRIISKIKSDPEPERVKYTELKLWTDIQKAATNGRRTGLGITAMGDMLASLGYTYGTTEATDFAEKVHKTIATEAYRSSVEMAKERGAFPLFDAEREVNNPFIRRIKESDPEIYEDMVKHGRRNIALLTIAPTGTTSMMTQTTSGIEPLFMPFYKRRRKINPNDEGATVDFVDEVGDSWEEYFVFHPQFKRWAFLNGYFDIETVDAEQLNEIYKLSPYYKASANDVDWLEKVKMQGRIQQWVDHSISVTVNIPEEATEQLVSDIYMKGWESGCKGMTIYRDGSRSGVLISATEKEERGEFVDNHAPKRGDELEATVLHFKNGRKDWVAIVGLKEGRPYEIFSGRNENAEDGEGLNIPVEIEEGIILRKKNGKNRYFLLADGFESDDLSKEFDPEYWNYAKLVSSSLRHGMPLQYVITMLESLKLPRGLWSWQSGVVRALKSFVPDGSSQKGSCPECEAESLVYQEGCLVCTNCGYGKCG